MRITFYNFTMTFYNLTVNVNLSPSVLVIHSIFVIRTFFKNVATEIEQNFEGFLVA